MEQVNTPYFSIIIPVYNGLSHELPTCLDSIWNQPLDKDLYEVICVDDCSTDHTREWLDKEAEMRPNLKIIKNDINIRQGGGETKASDRHRENIFCSSTRTTIIIPAFFLRYTNICKKTIWKF